MARVFSVGTIPKNIPTWQYNAFRQIGAAISGTNDGMSAILRGEAPDGSGSSLIDTSKFFYKPGLSGGQLAFGGINATDSLTLSSTSAQTKNFIYFDASKSLMAFDERQGFLGIGTVTPAALLHTYISSPSGTFARFQPGTFTIPTCTLNGTITVTCVGAGSSSYTPTGGPRVVPGMYVTSSDGGIPAGTQVKNIATSTSMTLTAAATTSAVVTLTFSTYVDVNAVSDETGRDMEWKVYGGMRFSTGTNSTAPLRVVGDTETVAANVSATARVYLEVGTISSGSATGTNLQIGGPGHGDLDNLFIRSKKLYFDDPVSGAQPVFGISLNPAEYGNQLGPSANFAMQRTAATGMVLLGATGGSTEATFLVLPAGAISGTSPNKTLAVTSYWFKITDSGRMYVGSANGDNAFYATGSAFGFAFFGASTNLNLLASAIGTTAWSDSQLSMGLHLGAATGTSAKRVFLSCAGNVSLDRLGLSSAYTLISNAIPGNAEFLSPTTPAVLQVINSSSTGTDSTVVLKVRTQRTGQTGNIQEWVTSSGAAISAINAAGAFAGNTTLVSYDDNLILIDDDTVYY